MMIKPPQTIKIEKNCFEEKKKQTESNRKKDRTHARDYDIFHSGSKLFKFMPCDSGFHLIAKKN